MSDCPQHFILTRFNLRIWKKDKNGQLVRKREWLEDRFVLFERFCLPSIANQTCKSFEWIILFDSGTPDEFKKRVVEYKKICPQLVDVYVPPVEGRYFRAVFQSEVIKRLEGRRVITTYLDNDDALDIHFVEDLQRRANVLSVGTFVSYSKGYQYFTSFQLMLQIKYPRNHFISVIEAGDPETAKTIYGYGSHYYIKKNPGVRIEYVKERPMWCEVIHQRNMGNDAYFLLGTKMICDDQTLQRDFAVNETISHGWVVLCLKFLPRYISIFIHRIRYFFFGRNWE